MALLSFLSKAPKTLAPIEVIAARVNQALPAQNEPFVGFGDSSNARSTLNALQGAVSTGVRAIRQRVQGLEIGVFQRRFINGEIEDVPAFNHPLQKLLDSPTLAPDGSITHSASQFWGMATTHLLAVGESYLIVIHDGAGIPVGLQMAPPGTIEPLISGGRFTGYRTISAGSAGRTLRPLDVVRIWEPDPYELFTSSSVMARNATIINADAFVNQTNERFYKHDATPKLVFEADDINEEFPSQEKQEASELSWIQRLNNRIGRRRGAPAWVLPGWKIKQLSSESEAKQRVDMLTYSTRRVWNAIGVPASIVGDVVDANRAAAETNQFVFDQNTIQPITLTIAEALTDQLAGQYPQNGDVRLIVKYRPFIARDKAHDLARDIADLKNKTRNINEVRQAREPSLPVVDWGNLPVGTFGDTPYTGEIEEIDLSEFGFDEEAAEEVTALVDAVEETEEIPEEERGKRLYAHYSELCAHFTKEREWARAVDRDTRWTPKFQARQAAVFERQGQEVVRRYLRGTSRARMVAGLPDDMKAHASIGRAEADELVDEIMPLAGWGKLFSVTEQVRAAAFGSSATEATLAITGQSFTLTKAAREILRQQSLAHYVFVNESTRASLVDVIDSAIAEGLGVDDTARKIGKLFGKRKGDAKRIAHTEIASAIQQAQTEGYRQTGIVEKQQWNTALDDRVRDSHNIDGQIVDLDEPFSLANGAQTRAPASPELDPGDRVNCRCFLTPVLPGDVNG